jgi:hypothetical protein
MDNNLFKQRLSEVAEWRIPKIKESPAEKRKSAGRPTKEEQYQELHEETFIELFQGENPTQAPELVKVKRSAVDCGDCGEHCPQGRDVENRKFFTHETHWRKRCITCGMNQNPFNGRFDLNNKDASGVWSLFLRRMPCNRFKNIPIDFQQD